MLPTSSPESTVQPVARIAKELAASSGFLLGRLGFRFKSRVIARLEEEGFEMYHYTVLAILDEGARHTQSTIAVALGLDPSRLVAVLDSLETDGLIARQRDPLDRRRHVVSITPAGRKQLNQLRAIVKQLEDEYLAPLDEADRATLHVLLERLAAHNEPSCAFLKPLVAEQPPAAADAS